MNIPGDVLDFLILAAAILDFRFFSLHEPTGDLSNVKLFYTYSAGCNGILVCFSV